MNVNERDYDIREIEVDERFTIAKREMLITFVVQLAYTFLMLVVAYSLGKGDPTLYRFVKGMPEWWFWCLVITFGFLGLIYYLVRRVFKDIPIDPWL